MKKVIGLVLGLVPVSAFAECVPVPDCASIGYTETSCDGDNVKCPFDTSKLKCIPCDSSFRFSCDGDNIVSAVGNACNNKYAACTCITGATFSNGECICDTSCSVGNIYYSDGTCNSCLDENKTVIGVVVKKDKLVMSNQTVRLHWSNSASPVAGSLSYEDKESALTDFDGQTNTTNIVAFYGEDTDPTTNATVHCYNFATEGTSAKDWYLPAAGELYETIVTNYNLIYPTYKNQLGWNGGISAAWSSSHTKYHGAWVIHTNGTVAAATRNVGTYLVYCFLHI